MTKLEAYRILSKMWNDVTQEQEEAINIAMDAIEFVDLMPKDMVAVVRCKDCKHFNMREMECQNDAVSTDHEGGASYSLNFYLDDFCSYGERRGTDG